LLSLASSTLPQLALSDPTAGTNLKHWIMRSVGGNLYFATSSDLYATSTNSAFSITSTGVVNIAALDCSGASRLLQTDVSGNLTCGDDDSAAGGNPNSKFATSTNAYKAIYPSGDTDGGVRVGIGTTTPYFLLSLASSTIPQLALSDPTAGTNLKHWVARSVGGNLYFATSSDLYATSTTASLTLLNNGNVGIGTSSPFGLLSVSGSTTDPSLVVRQATSTTNGLLASFFSGSDNARQVASIRGFNFSQLSSTTNSNAFNGAGNRIVISGGYAYVSATNRLVTIDISDPRYPTTTSILSSAALGSPEIFSVAGNYAYLPDSTGGALNIIDISNASSTTIVGTLTHANLAGARSAYVKGRYVYVAGNASGLSVVDVSNPANPVLVGYRALSNARDVEVIGRYAYIARVSTAGFAVIDVSNPANPILVKNLQNTTYLQNNQSLEVVGRYAYVTAADIDRLTIVDISNPTNPVIAGSITDATNLNNPRDIVISGNYAYVTTNSDPTGITTVDVSSTTAPVVVAAQPVDNANGVAVSGNRIYSIGIGSNTFTIFEGAGANLAALTTGATQITGPLTVFGASSFSNTLTANAGINIGGNGLISTAAGLFSLFATTSASSSPALSAAITDSSSDSLVDVLEIGHFASSTSANGIGVGLLFNLEDSSGLSTSTARIGSIFSGVTNATPKSVLTFSTKNTSGSLTEYMRLDENGRLGLGTTTPAWMLQLATSTVGQLALTDPTAGTDLKHWIMRSVGGNLYFATSNDAYATNTIAALTFTKTGSVGIGTTSPWAKFSINNSTSDTAGQPLFAVASSTATATTTLFSIDNAGLTTIGNSLGTGNANFQFANDTNAWTMGYNSTDKSFNIASSTNLSSSVALTITKGTSLLTGISSTTPWRTLSVNGTMAVNGLSAVTGTDASICIDPTTFELTTQTGDTCFVSSARYKHDINALPDTGLDMLRTFRPVSFKYNGEVASTTYWGFIAEDMASTSPQLAAFNLDGSVQTINSTAILSVAVKALAELDLNILTIASSTESSTPESRSFADNFFNGIFSKLVEWFASAANGVEKFFAKEVHTDTLCVKKSDGTEVCLTGDQLSALLSGQSVAPAPAPEPTPEPAPTTESAPDSTSSPQAEPTPASEPTPAPAPEPTPEPAPTTESAPDSTSSPQAEPTPASEPTPAPAPEPTPEPIVEPAPEPVATDIQTP
ncbi:MAG: tail fiber domain-containing protein, partial [Patescibacteria group bacterium]